VDYSTDLPQAIELCAKAASQVERVIGNPAPICLTRSFGESSIDLELRFWINDPQNGIANVSSDIYLAIWNSFKENGIQLPFPQRDIHLKTIPENSLKNISNNLF
jgi:small-conductance mechanosensitive channel